MSPKSHYKQSRWFIAFIKKLLGIHCPSLGGYEYDRMRYNHKYGYYYPLTPFYTSRSDGTYVKIKEMSDEMVQGFSEIRKCE